MAKSQGNLQHINSEKKSKKKKKSLLTLCGQTFSSITMQFKCPLNDCHILYNHFIFFYILQKINSGMIASLYTHIFYTKRKKKVLIHAHTMHGHGQKYYEQVVKLWHTNPHT